MVDKSAADMGAVEHKRRNVRANEWYRMPMHWLVQRVPH